MTGPLGFEGSASFGLQRSKTRNRARAIPTLRAGGRARISKTSRSAPSPPFQDSEISREAEEFEEDSGLEDSPQLEESQDAEEAHELVDTNSIPSVDRAVQSLKNLIGDKYVRSTTRAQPRARMGVTTLPDLIGLGALTRLFDQPAPMIKQKLLEFLRSSGVLPQVAMWHQECSKNERKLYLALEARLPQEWSDEAARELAEHIAWLAQLSQDELKAEETCEAVLLCVDYTKSLRSKNLSGFFSNYDLYESEKFRICSSILLVVLQDLKGNEKGFFGTLLRSRLTVPMPAELRAIWEAKFQLRSDAFATSSATTNKGSARIDPALWKSMRGVGEIDGQASTDKAVLQAEMGRSANQHDIAPLSDEEIAEEMGMQGMKSDKLPEPPEPVKNPRDELEISRHKYEQCQYERDLETIKHAPDVKVNPFTPNEQLIFLEVFLEMQTMGRQKKALLKKERVPWIKLISQREAFMAKLTQKEKWNEEKKMGWKEGEVLNKKEHAEHDLLLSTIYASAMVSFDHIAERLPRRSRIECIQHHAMMRMKLHPPGYGEKVGKRPAEEPAEGAHLDKKRAMSKHTPLDSTLSPLTNPNTAPEKNAGGSDLESRCEARIAELCKQHEQALARKDRAMQQEKQSHDGLLAQLRDELRTDFEKELAKKDHALEFEKNLHASSITALKADKDHALLQRMQSHDIDLAQLRGEVRKNFKSKLAKADTDIKELRRTRDEALKMKEVAVDDLANLKKAIQDVDRQARRIANIKKGECPKNMTLAERHYKELKESVDKFAENEDERIADIDRGEDLENMTVAEKKYKLLRDIAREQPGRIDALANGKQPENMTYAEIAIQRLLARVQQLKYAMTERKVPIPQSRR